MNWLEQRWYQDKPPPLALRPLASLFEALARRRRSDYLAKRESGSLWRPSIPVIVVGNITVGGTGKTPMVIALVEHLRAQGWRPGIVSRGYGGNPPELPLRVNEDTPVEACGDEPFMIYRRLKLPLYIDPDRRRAAEQLVQDGECDIILSDDGMQHYGLHRDMELLVLDGERGLGNRSCLPAGPLREPAGRIEEVDAVLVNGKLNRPLAVSAPMFELTLAPGALHNMVTGDCLELEAIPAEVHAVAGIGNPQRFFNTLVQMGSKVEGHVFPDHFSYSRQDIEFKDNKPVIMTEKDAVKCLGFASEQHWYLSVAFELPKTFIQWLDDQLQRLKGEIAN